MSFGMAYATKKRSGKGAKMCADGGEVNSLEDDDKAFSADVSRNNSQAKFAEQSAQIGDDVEANHMYAHGGMAEHEKDADMIARIMHKRKEYAKGGVVANEDAPIADSMPAEFDDMEEDDHLEAHEDASNEKGDADVSDDPIDRIMMKRKKK